MALGGIDRRACYSLDEKALFNLHHHQQSSTASQQPSSLPPYAAPGPTKPPYAPPKRTRTPEGVPSWPGLAQRRIGQPELTGNVIQRSHKRIARAVVRALRRKKKDKNSKRAKICRTLGLEIPRVDTRPVAQWRPPMSGHTTFRFGALESHRFNHAVPSLPGIGDSPAVRNPSKGTPLSPDNLFTQRVQRSRASVPNIEFRTPLEEDETPLLDSRDDSQRHRPTSSDDSVVVSPSARALAALSELPLPVSTARIAAQTARRSSSIPRSRLQSPEHGTGSGRRSTYPSCTMKTSDMIKAFPEPPPWNALRLKPASPALMSLFPALARLEERSGKTARIRTTGCQEAAQQFACGHAESQNSVRESMVSKCPQGMSEAANSQLSRDWEAQCSGALPNPASSGCAMDTS